MSATMTASPRMFPCDSPNGHIAAIVRTYTSLRDLSMAIKGLGRADDDAILSVLVVLDTTFCGDLRSVIRRCHAGYRLTITALTPNLCLPVTAETLASESGRLGWCSIKTEADLRAAVERAQLTVANDEQSVIFWPQWRDSATLHREG